MAEARITRPDIRLVALFSFAGPLIGATVTLILPFTVAAVIRGWLAGVNEAVDVGATLMLLTLVACLAVGLVPAALTGLGAAIFSRRNPSPRRWLAGCAALGFATSFLTYVVWSILVPNGPFAYLTGASDLIWMVLTIVGVGAIVGLVGAVSALICAWIASRWRAT